MDLLEMLRELPLSQAVRQTRWAYPAANTVHVAALAVFFGTILAFDLRMLGRARAIEARALARHLLPLTVGAFAVLVASGILLFLVNPPRIWANPFFQWKLALIVLGLANAAAFHRFCRDYFETDRARLLALASLGLWSAALVCGRLIAYA